MFLDEPPHDEQVDALHTADREEGGYVWNFTRLWGWRPELLERFVELRTGLMEASGLGERDWAVLVTATASELRDSYCSLAWGKKLAALVDAETAGQVLAGAEAPALSEREAALREWARQVVRDPNATSTAGVERLRAAGLDDREIFDATASLRSGSRSRRSTTRSAPHPTGSSPTPPPRPSGPRSTTAGRPRPSPPLPESG